jgi:hypothetical protein
MTKQNVPIFCEHCRVLALANLESVPLCPKCLMTALKESQDPYIICKITPLFVSHSGLKGLVKSRTSKGVAVPVIRSNSLSAKPSH